MLLLMGPSQFIYAYIISYMYPDVEIKKLFPWIFLFLFPLVSIYLFINYKKPYVQKKGSDFIMIPLFVFGFYNSYQAFETNFHIDYLLASFITIFGGILLINRHKQLIIYSCSYFLYYAIMFYVFPYTIETRTSIFLALIVIISFSFVIQNAFITYRKEQIKYKQKLKEQVRSRTITIENKLSIIEKKNNDLEEYAHVVSHDLKAPLRNIDTLVNWVIEDNKDGMGESCLNSLTMVLSNVEKMDLLIKGILDYSTIDKLESEDRLLNINLIIDEVLRTLFVPKNINIKTQDDLPKIYGNAWRFKQVFQNLIQNAIKYNHKEKGIIEIGATEKENYFEFFVKDNGIGISDTYFDRIFKVFTKLESNTSSSGIGLSIVKKIVNYYNGEIWLESQEGIGTTFFFTILKYDGTT
ncbi:GHKL domain-containing protein [Flavobacterium jejuense]|uniref:histidine kinase n=2 Tax=Flavobacterium jejuense TaxID=1544455 RepID=A0ABX0IVQ3_9FLAO|nr:GHKL domain-containing protein [Flavobacterium jejuense]